MIKSKDLRLGNLVTVGKDAVSFTKGGPVVLEILELKEKTAAFRQLDHCEYYKDLKGIRLEAFHLLAFDFIETKGEYYFNDFEIKLKYNPVMKVWVVFFHDFNHQVFIHLTAIKSVHELQNVYYALFSDDLKYEYKRFTQKTI